MRMAKTACGKPWLAASAGATLPRHCQGGGELSTPKRAARIIATVLTDTSTVTGEYYNEKGQPMIGSTQVRDPAFQDRVVAETRALLSTVPTLI